MSNLLLKKSATAVLGMLIVASGIYAQQVDRGFQAANTYASSGIDAVNLSNGNLVLNLPVASLPAGRGGSPGYAITLQYNSKLWDSHYASRDDGYPDENGNTRFSTNTLALSETGGWSLRTKYTLQVFDRLNYETPNVCWLDDPVEKLAFRWKVQMEMPDGTVKQFFPETARNFDVGLGDDGYANISPNGTIYSAEKLTEPTCHTDQDTSQATTSGMTYITMDGSRLRLFIPYNSDRWKLYSPNGTLVENYPVDDSSVVQRVSDRNGNKVENKTDGKIIDQLGRYIQFLSDEDPGDIIRIKGVGGAPVDVRIIWGTRWVYRKYRVTQALNAQETQQFDEISTSIQVVEKIVYPTQLGTQEMLFEYLADDEEPESEEYTVGWGELRKVTLPTGAETDYEFATPGLLAEDERIASDVMGRFVTSKELGYEDNYDGGSPVPRSDPWEYEVSTSSNWVTNPDGSTSIENLIAYFGPPSNWDAGMAYSSVRPGVKVDRLWAINLPYSQTPPGDMAAVGNGNAYVKTEFTTVSSSDIEANWLTAIKDYKYDKNGNVLEILEYDFVTYGTVPKTNGRVTGLPSSGLTLKRKTINTYYNQAADATSSTGNGNEYNDATPPKLLNLIKTTEIHDGGSSIKARSEFLYDDPDDTGNLTETKAWDSTKGALSSPDGNGFRLDSGNSISTLAEYDSYGNVIETTDANSNIATITYGNITCPVGTVTGLYPTQTVVADGTAIERTSSATYDCYTGLVLTTTDVDNDVTNAMEYDDLGRPTKAITAQGTALESWTQTIYNDVARRVIVKSDLETVEDGKKVAIQHYDQLGRVRLSRTLEDSATEDPTDETDGIKVQTRYKATGTLCPWDNASGPEEVCSAQVVSNPYRAATSSAASGETTMGWTVTRTQNNGKRSETETYGGAALPKPFLTSGFNTNTSGAVKTEVDANATTVTDQAGKLRRSITNALGQLTRVDEPNGSNVLGDVDTPNQATSYAYNTLGKMVHVQQGDQHRYFMYDSLGRMLRVRQPEQEVNTALNTSGNPDNNSWTAGFTYDNNGNVLTAKDAKNVTVTNTYDELNRPLTRTYSDGTPTVTNYYDGLGLPSVPDNSKGKLTRVSSSISESRYTEFDILGRLKEFKQITDGTTYTSKYTYNLSGALIEEEYPSGRKVKNQFDQNGDLQRIFGNATSVATERTYANSFSYSPDGKIERLRLGNGLWEAAKFNSRLQVTEFTLGHGPASGDLWKLNIDYGELQTNGTVDVAKNSGSIGKQTLTFNGLANSFIQTFKYDSLYRLTEAKETNNSNQTWKQIFGYDRYGNRTTHEKFTGTTQLTLDAETHPEIDDDTNRLASGEGYTFDANGNVVVDAQGRQFTFNGDNKQTKVKDDQNNVIGDYFYDGEGKRVKKVVGSETTVFVHSAGKLIAEYSTETPPANPTTSYTITDQLGSPRIIVNALGEVVSRRDFLPFGEEIELDGTYRTTAKKYGQEDQVRQKFTGYQYDKETELDFAEARMYEKRHGRFTAIDPLLASGKSADPQTFNRYVYVLNDPLNLTDPSGLQAGSDLEPGCASESDCWGYANGDGTVTANGEATVEVSAIENFISSTFQEAVDGVSFLFRYQFNRGAAIRDGGNPLQGSPVVGTMGPNSNDVVDSYLEAVDRAAFVANVGFTVQSAFIGGFASRGSTMASNSGLSFGTAVSRGLLTTSDANAGGAIRSFVTAADQTFYRVSSSAGTETGGFLTAVPPRSSAYAREALALPGGNDASLMQEVLVPAGTRLQRSRAAPLNGRPGGGEQFQLLNRLPAENFGPRQQFEVFLRTNSLVRINF